MTVTATIPTVPTADEYKAAQDPLWHGSSLIEKIAYTLAAFDTGGEPSGAVVTAANIGELWMFVDDVKAILEKIGRDIAAVEEQVLPVMMSIYRDGDGMTVRTVAAS
jgi:hypothetical protein